MAEQLKTFFSRALVRRLAADIARVEPSFATRAFIARATAGLEDLELLDRGAHIAGALAAHLPTDYPRAVAVLVRSLGPEHATDELVGVGMAPFFYLPHTLFVARHGLDHFDQSMRAQYELTKRFSAEASIRPFIAKDPERTLGVLREWALDPSPHVRRLVSEGTRLRLPWARRVAWLDRNPGRVLELLELLKDDPASLVRRSVANNLNDLGRVHLALLVRTAAAWSRGASADRRALVEHALRGAVRRGEPEALRLLGYGRAAAIALGRVRFEPSRVPIGGRVVLSFELVSESQKAQRLLVDVAVHFRKVDGRAIPKVFKLERIELAPGARVSMRLAVSLAVHSTRRPHPGVHAVDVVVNGEPIRAGSFRVTAPST